MKLKHYLAVVLLLLLSLTACSCNGMLPKMPTTAEKITSVAYRVLVDCNGDHQADGLGSATAIGHSTFLTANHVVSDCDNPDVILVSPDGESKRAELALRMVGKDQAILRLTKGQAPLMRWAETECEEPAVGDQVFVYTGDGDLPMFYKDGYVSSLNASMIAFSIHVVPGNSGSGLFDRYGCLLGVVRGGDFKSVSEELWGVAMRL